MLTNSDIREALSQLAAAVARADKALAQSDDLPPLDLAQTMVEGKKLSDKLTKFADRVERLSAPLFGRDNGQAGADESSRPAGRKRK
jgi:uncharacterized membrane protein YccC